MSADPEPVRPKAVTAIAWIWIVLAALFLFRSLLDPFIWTVLKPAAPSLMAAMEQRSPRMALLRPLFGHFTAVKTVEAAAAVAVGFFAVALYRLRAWARVAIQAVCWTGVIYLVSFAALWATLWTRISGGTGAGASAHRSFVLGAGLALCLALAIGLIAMSAVLRTPAVRNAFRPAPSDAMPPGTP